MGIGPAETERVHTHDELARLAQFAVLGDDVQVPVLEFDLGIERLDADGGRHHPMAQHIHRLDQARHAGRGFQVAQVALDRPDGQRRVFAALLRQGGADGARLDGVTDGGARAVRFQVIDIGGRNACLFIGLAHQRGLRVGAGHRQARLAAVGVDGRSGHDGQDVVAVGNGLVIILQQENAAAFRADVAVARGVKDIAAAARRQHRCLGECNETVRVQMQTHASCEGLAALAGDDAAASLVECDQR